MKKWLAVLCVAAVLCLTIACPAMAASMDNAVLVLFSRDALGIDTMLGSGVLLQDGLLTTTLAAQAQGSLYAASDSSAYSVTKATLLPGSIGLLFLTLDSDTAIAPLSLSTADEADLTLMGVDASGKAVHSDVTLLNAVMWRETDCRLISAKPGALCGAAVLDDSGCLAGIVTAIYGEGEGRYVMLPAAAIAAALSNATASTEAPPESTVLPAADDAAVWLTDVTLTAQNAQVTVDWSKSEIADLSEDSVFTVFYADADNPYYSYMQLPADETSSVLYCVPGRTMEVWVQHAHGEGLIDVKLPADCASITLDKTHPFNKYGYRDTAFYLGLLPEAQADDPSAVAVALDKVTAEDLLGQNGALCMQVTSRYRVTRSSDSILMTALYTPDGSCYPLHSGFSFLEDLTEDIWHVNLTPLLSSYARFSNGIASGSYTLCYYLDGTLGSQLTFEVE